MAGAVVWVVANLPAMLTGLPQWKVFWEFNSDRGPDLGSLWYVAAQRGHPASPHTINVGRGYLRRACLGVLVLGLVARPRRGWRSWLPDRGGFLLVNKVYSPQYVLWLLPLAVLARPRWRDLLIWQAGELFYFGAVWLFLGGYTASGTDRWRRSASTRPRSWSGCSPSSCSGGLVVRDVLEPHKDPVRAHDPVMPLEPLGEPVVAR